MNLIYIAIIVLGAFVAVWFFLIEPAERRHHERKLESIKKKIEQRETTRKEQRTSGNNEPADLSHKN